MKYRLPPLLLLIIIAVIFGYFRLCPLLGCYVWSWPQIKQWGTENQGVFQFLALVVAIISTPGLVRYVISKRRKSMQNAERIVLEHNYLRELIQWFRDEKRDPLSADESEILELKAELVRHRYRLVSAAGSHDETHGKGNFTYDLVSTLLESKEPVVVLGAPGAGKSVSLSKAMLTLARNGLTQKEPRLPIYLRLGGFTDPITEGVEDVLEFARGSLRDLGGHAKEIERDLDRYLAQGRVVFLLDAMDEMPRRDYEKRFEAVKKLNRLTPNKILYACRELDFQENFPFLRAHIQPFDRDQIKRLLRGTLGELGREASKEILSPRNRLRDMAHNPFFLKLLAEFYREYRRLPFSRAELMKVYEDTVFKRAMRRAGFPADLDPQILRAVLARLAYVITTSKRGVTIPLRDFLSQFSPPGTTDAEERLKALEDKVEKVLTICIDERLLHAELKATQHEAVGNTSKILSFHHHRLQEYYTAVYFEELGDWPDWEESIDDIWYQEILVMLFGISSSAVERMQALLRYLPPRPILCHEFGAAIGCLLARLPRAPYVGREQRWSSSKAVRDALVEMDATGFYGLRDKIPPSKDEGVLLEALTEAGVLIDAKRVNKDEIESLLELSAEPDEMPACESIRSWLERHNAVVLDRLELVVECFRNAVSKIEEASRAQSMREQVVTLLTAYSKDGNILEAVRAIQIAVRLPGVELYSVIEPALMSKDSWCRGEAVSAMAKCPLADNTHRRQTGFIIFLRFLQGDLFYPEPIPFLRSLKEIVLPARSIFGFLLLSALTYLAALSPLLIYMTFQARFASVLSEAGALRGFGWGAWLFVFGLVICSVAVYFAKARLNIPILRTSLLACSLCVFIPPIIGILRGGPKVTAMSEDHQIRVRENASAYLAATPDLLKITGLTGAMIGAPQVVEVGALIVIAMVCSLLFGSLKILRAPVIYVKNIRALSTWLDWGQVLLLKGLGIFGAMIVLKMLLSLFIVYVHAAYYVLLIFILGILPLVMIVATISVVRADIRHKRKNPLHILWELLTDRQELSSAGKFLAKWMVICVPSIAVYAGIVWILYGIYKTLMSGPYSYLLFIPAISISIVIVLFLTLNSSVLRDLVRVYRRGLLAGDGTLSLFPGLAVSPDRVSSAEERFTLCRSELQHIRSEWVRGILYREMHKAYRQMRQKNRNMLV